MFDLGLFGTVLKCEIVYSKVWQSCSGLNDKCVAYIADAWTCGNTFDLI